MTFEIENVYPEVILPDYETVIKNVIEAALDYAKGTPSLLAELRPLVGARFQVLFHSSVRSAFHLSLTVLVHYRSLGSI